jgi:hypothetical protein
MYRDINRSHKSASPMLGAGLIALILLITGFTLVAMHPDASDQTRSSVATGMVVNNEGALAR